MAVVVAVLRGGWMANSPNPFQRRQLLLPPVPCRRKLLRVALVPLLSGHLRPGFNRFLLTAIGTLSVVVVRSAGRHGVERRVDRDDSAPFGSHRQQRGRTRRGTVADDYCDHAHVVEAEEVAEAPVDCRSHRHRL